MAATGADRRRGAAGAAPRHRARRHLQELRRRSRPTRTSTSPSRRGTIHGIVGENGAGKSTLMSILYGFYQADAGEIRVDGKPTPIPDSQAAIRAGIGMVHQHFMLVEPFTVLENVMLGAEGGRAAAAVARQGAGGAEAARGGIRARGRSRRGRRRALGRAAAAGRDPEGALPRVRHPDPRRADRRADPGRGRPSLPHPRAPEGRGQDDHPDHPQAARDHGGDRRGQRHAPRRDGGDAASPPRPARPSSPS